MAWPEMEPRDVIPSQISQHAWKTAMLIDQEVASLLDEYGFRRKEGASKMVTVIAKMVQMAINQEFERIVKLAK